MANWSTFNLDEALAGSLVGYPPEGDTSSVDYSVSGKLHGPGPIYKLYINGKLIKTDATGKVKQSAVSEVTVDSYLMMVTPSLDSSTAVGVRSRGRTDPNPPQGATATNEVNLTVMQPRDHFAIAALKVLMERQEHPESTDDGTILALSQSAYRWAHGMVEAAYDARYGKYEYPVTPGEIDEIEVDTDSIESNTDKILYNISQYLKHAAEKGLPVLNAEEEVTEGGQTITRKVAIETVVNDVKKVANCTDLATLLSTNGIKVAAMPTTTHVTIDGTPNVAISGTPNVNVANSPSVSVSNMPSSIDVDNFPATQAVSGTVDIGNWPSNNNT